MLSRIDTPPCTRCTRMDKVRLSQGSCGPRRLRARATSLSAGRGLTLKDGLCPSAGLDKSASGRKKLHLQDLLVLLVDTPDNSFIFQPGSFSPPLCPVSPCWCASLLSHCGSMLANISRARNGMSSSSASNVKDLRLRASIALNFVHQTRNKHMNLTQP